MTQKFIGSVSIFGSDNINEEPALDVSGNTILGIHPKKHTTIINAKMMFNGPVAHSQNASDTRIKNIKNKSVLSDTIEKIQKVGIYDFSYKEPYDSFVSKKEKTGLLADELQEQFPDCIDHMPIGDLPDCKIIDYQQLTVYLLDAVKKLSHEVQELKEKIKE